MYRLQMLQNNKTTGERTRLEESERREKKQKKNDTWNTDFASTDVNEQLIYIEHAVH